MRQVVKKAATASGIAVREISAPRVSAVADKAAASGAIVLKSDSTTSDAFRSIAGALVELIAAQQAAVRQRDPAGVHQMRIALRRMRAAITIFAELVHGPEVERLKAELRWLTGRLGPARDLHLMSQRLDGTAGVGSPAFRKQLEADRSSAFDVASQAVATRRFDKLLGDLKSWIEAGNWAQTSQDVPQSAKKFAKRLLKHRAARLTRKLDRLEELDDKQRHRVRIAAKKLYYAAGFFESLFNGSNNGKRLARFRIQLKKLLDALGALNDVAVQRELADSIASLAQAKTAPNAPAMELAAEEAATRKQLKVAVKVATKLADTPLFGD